MTKRVLDVGNCTPDHSAIRALLGNNFEVAIIQSHDGDDALRQLQGGQFDLVLLNRIFDRNGEEGMDVLRRIKSDEQLASLPVMLLTNYPEHQQAAIAQGAEPGFGKAELQQPQTRENLRRFLA